MVKYTYNRQPLDLIPGTASITDGGSSTILDMSDTSTWGGRIAVFETLEIVNTGGATATVTLNDGTNDYRTVTVATGETEDIAPEVVTVGKKLIISVSGSNVTVNYKYALLPHEMVIEVKTE